MLLSAVSQLLMKAFGQLPAPDWQCNLKAGLPAWSKDNASALAICSLIAYFDGTEVNRQFIASRGFTAPPLFFSVQEIGVDSQAILVERADMAVLIFRGTEPVNLVDWITDSRVNQVPFRDIFAFEGAEMWGNVHQGFATALAPLLRGVLPELNRIVRSDRPIWITGHSLGGALAMLAAAFIIHVFPGRIGAVYTFGQPRVGDAGFSKAFDNARELAAATYRCVNDRDIVPRLPPRELREAQRLLIGDAPRLFAEPVVPAVLRSPPSIGYEHAGQLRLMEPTASGITQVSQDLSDERRLDPTGLAGSPLIGDWASWFATSSELLAVWIPEHFPIGLSDMQVGYLDRIARI